MKDIMANRETYKRVREPIREADEKNCYDLTKTVEGLVKAHWGILVTDILSMQLTDRSPDHQDIS